MPEVASRDLAAFQTLPPKRRWRPSPTLVPYLYIAPAVAIVGFALLYPIAVVINDSFETLGAGPTSFVGSSNYSLVLTDPIFWQAIRDNLTLLLAVPIMVVLSALFSILLFERLPGWQLYRTIIFLPYIMAITVVATIFGLLYGFDGPLNLALRSVHLGALALDWLGSP